jgi:hypothetical protein
VLKINTPWQKYDHASGQWWIKATLTVHISVLIAVHRTFIVLTGQGKNEEGSKEQRADLEKSFGEQ